MSTVLNDHMGRELEMPKTPMFATALTALALAVAVPAALASGASGRHLEPGDDRGAAVQTGDDRGAAVQPGDDRGAAVQPGDDKGTAVEPGDDKGVAVEPGDDRGVVRVVVKTRESKPLSAKAAPHVQSRQAHRHHRRHRRDG